MRALRFALPLVAVAATPAAATPSSNLWAPSTSAVQPFGVLHLTYDTYFGDTAAYPVDAGLTIGVLPWTGLQAEVGFDLFYPTVADGEGVALPLVLNAKVGGPEDGLFRGQPSWSVGAYGVGFEEGVTDAHILYGIVGRALPVVGSLWAGGYDATTAEEAGLIFGWASPSFHVPTLDKVYFSADVQTGENVFGAAAAGVYVYFTPAIDVALAGVYFFAPETQPGGARWMGTLALDVDVDLAGGAP